MKYSFVVDNLKDSFGKEIDVKVTILKDEDFPEEVSIDIDGKVVLLSGVDFRELKRLLDF
tara:strand:+ start:3574 stop:3753 length:180 start_codon:yes stop_codon:yes gene_type:complete